jgi:hypothetical protein
MRLYIGLLHYPVYNKHEQRIASAITTFDLHDIARLARTYEARRFFVITPLLDQMRLAERVKRHWVSGYGAGYNRNRKEAMERLAVVPSLEEAVGVIRREEGEDPVLIATDAAPQQRRGLSYDGARTVLRGHKPVMLLFGTAWGLDREILERANYVLEPICGRGGYNHLSVRSAAAIILDRLAGREDAPVGSPEESAAEPPA